MAIVNISIDTEKKSMAIDVDGKAFKGVKRVCAESYNGEVYFCADLEPVDQNGVRVNSYLTVASQNGGKTEIKSVAEVDEHMIGHASAAIRSEVRAVSKSIAKMLGHKN